MDTRAHRVQMLREDLVRTHSTQAQDLEIGGPAEALYYHYYR